VVELRDWHWSLWWIAGAVLVVLNGWYMVGGPEWAVPVLMFIPLVMVASQVRRVRLGVQLVYGALWINAVAFLWYVITR
jgi:hypothetical protein